MVSAGTPPAAALQQEGVAGSGRLARPGARGKKRGLRGTWTVREGNRLTGTDPRAPACRRGPGALLGADARRAESLFLRPRLPSRPKQERGSGWSARARQPASGPCSHQPLLPPKRALACNALRAPPRAPTAVLPSWPSLGARRPLPRPGLLRLQPQLPAQGSSWTAPSAGAHLSSSQHGRSTSEALPHTDSPSSLGEVIVLLNS